MPPQAFETTGLPLPPARFARKQQPGSIAHSRRQAESPTPVQAHECPHSADPNAPAPRPARYAPAQLQAPAEPLFENRPAQYSGRCEPPRPRQRDKQHRPASGSRRVPAHQPDAPRPPTRTQANQPLSALCGKTRTRDCTLDPTPTDYQSFIFVGPNDNDYNTGIRSVE